MMPVRLELDFVASSRRFSLAGVLVLVLGAAAAAWTVIDYRDLVTQSTLLAMQLDAASPRAGRGSTFVADTRGIDEATKVVIELALPWSNLLDDLEAAGAANSQDVALLSIEPDREKRRVRIGAEARTLPAALAFVQRLQRAGTLKFPLLDNHKVRTDVNERPVYFEMTADWDLSQ
jgi:hypothetical protein